MQQQLAERIKQALDRHCPGHINEVKEITTDRGKTHAVFAPSWPDLTTAILREPEVFSDVHQSESEFLRCGTEDLFPRGVKGNGRGGRLIVY